MKKSWIQWNKWYISAINQDEEEDLYEFFDAGCDQPGFFTKKRYIWNVIRGKGFCQYFADWIIHWYKKIIGGYINNTEFEKKVEDMLVRTIHLIMISEHHWNIRRSLVWKITKQAPILTVDTIPYISHERLFNILDSDKYIIADDAVRPFIQYCANLRMETDTAKALVTATQALIE